MPPVAFGSGSSMKSISVGKAQDEPDGVAPDGIPIHLVLCDFHTVPEAAVLGPMRFMNGADSQFPRRCAGAALGFGEIYRSIDE